MRSQKGTTNLEIMTAVLILGIVEAAVMPNFSSNDPKKLEVAARTITDAIIFARAEAMRTKVSHGISTDIANQRIRVYSLPAETAVYDVYHPIDKKIYDIQFKNDTQTAGVDLASASYSFEGLYSNSSHLDFNANGMPKFSGGIPQRDYMLTGAEMKLSFQGHQRIISIAPITGRVTVQ